LTREKFRNVNNERSNLRRFFKRRWHVHVLVLCVLWASLAYFAAQVQFRPLFFQELRTINFRFHARGAQPPPPEIVILAIDQRSFVADIFDEEDLLDAPAELRLMRNWPFPRRVHAAAIRKLCDAGAKVVAVDLLFTNPSNPEDDEALREAVAAHADRVVVGSNFERIETERKIFHVLMEPAPILPRNIPHETVAAYVNFWPDVDGFVRRMRTHTYVSDLAGVERSPGEPLLLSLAARAVEKFSGGVSLHDGREFAYINFTGPSGSFPSYPYYEVFYDKAWERNLKNGEVFRDKIVLIGPGGGFQHDMHMTPFGDGAPTHMPGVEIHAAAIGTLLHQTAPRDAPPWLEVVTILVLVALTALIVNMGAHPILKIFLLFAICAAYFGVSVAVFSRISVIMAVASPLWAVAGGGVLGIAVQLVAEQMEKRRVRQTLEKYVSKPVADEILRRGEEFEASLGGERKQATILFSDIRDFTSISERANPAELVGQLNEYLTAMVEIVMKNKGTLSKFIGDAIMAVYGVPLSDGEADDAWRAVKTAHEMRARLAELQKNWAENGRPTFKIGIGINHGEVLVGNVGSPQRMEYTVIGDAVNVASRVEGLNKEFGTDILLTESVLELVKGRVNARQIGAVSVKGREQKVNVYLLESLIS
jgi:adenylate cyclase